MEFWHVISTIIGWVYFIAWSVSFYPQVILNARRQSCVGLSVEFVIFNLVGFGCYTVYTALFLWNSYIMKQYRDRNGGKDNLVDLNDFAFALHASVLTTITLIQCFWFKAEVKKSIFSYFLIIALLVILLFAVLSLAGKVTWLTFVYVLSYVKIFTSVAKYLPQMILNYQRKSTEGWSIANILLDFIGGMLSILQLVLDCAISGNWSGFTGNIVKVMLGGLSLFYDIIFILQHYYFFRNPSYVPVEDDDLEAFDEDKEL